MQEHLQANGNKKQESFTGPGPAAINLVQKYHSPKNAHPNSLLASVRFIFN
jgi:hypothetical protein